MVLVRIKPVETEMFLADRQSKGLAPAPPFATIVREHQAMVYSIGWHFLRDRAVAEELAQDVFLQLYKNLASIESAAHVTNWLRRVMTQRCIDYSRRLRLVRRVSLEDAPEPSVAAMERDPLLSEMLDRQIARLPERSRLIVILRFQEEMEPAEIAQVMGLPVGTVKSNLHRALVLLRGRMERVRV
jgi:RNA polymerase sigma-70 factor, ECF subfamily